VLAGGATPRAAYRLLAGDPARRDGIPWRCVQIFQGDERAVPPDHPDSNWRMAREAFLDALRAGDLLPEENLHRIAAEAADPESAAADYGRMLRDLPVRGTGGPLFDLVLLGLGEDGHTASLFPRSPVLTETKHFVMAPWVDPPGVRRFTLTFPAINAAACVAFLVSGPAKAAVLARALQESARAAGGGALPAARVRPEHGEVVWLVDRAAAGALPAAI